MKREAKLGLGFALVAIPVVIILLLITVFHPQAPQKPVAKSTINCEIGSEKADLMNDPDIKRILDEKYGLTVNFNQMGSLDQATMKTTDIKQQGLDCLWPSSMAAQNLFKAKHGNDFPEYRAETVLTSPEVIYAGKNGTDALLKAGIVEQRDGKYYIINMKVLLDYVLQKKSWDSLGWKGHGIIKINSTDPAKSNSGFTMSLLELTIVSTDDPSQPPSADQVKAKNGLQTIRALYDAQGLQATSSAFGFSAWLNQGGELRSPLYAGYESQILELAKNKAALQNVRILYPEPTVYNEHPIMALDKKASSLIDAMKDSEIQKIAWQKYGFRSVQLGLTDVNFADFKGIAIADNLQSTDVPNGDVIEELQNCLANNVCQ